MPGPARAEGAELGDEVPQEILDRFQASPADMGTSILTDREACRPLEWDIRNGVVSRRGRAHRIRRRSATSRCRSSPPRATALVDPSADDRLVTLLSLALGAGVLSGVVGSGSSLIMPPVLVDQYRPRNAMPIVAIASLLSNIGRLIVWWHVRISVAAGQCIRIELDIRNRGNWTQRSALGTSPRR